MFQLKTNSGITWLESSLLRTTGNIQHAFSTRLGGVSPYPFDSLNMGFKTQDEWQNVIENRTRFLKRFAIDPEQATSLNFVHSDKIVKVQQADAGKGFSDQNEVLGDFDGMATNEKGIALFITFSDCAPLLFYDPVQEVIAASHSGWRGTIAGMPERTIQFMKEEFACQVEDIHVGLGPTIGQEAFEVGQDVVDAYRTRYPEWTRLFTGGKEVPLHLDLAEAVVTQLQATGVLADHIDRCPLSTHEEEELFFSYRRMGRENYGVMGAFIMLEN